MSAFKERSWDSEEDRMPKPKAAPSPRRDGSTNAAPLSKAPEEDAPDEPVDEGVEEAVNEPSEADDGTEATGQASLFNFDDGEPDANGGRDAEEDKD
jgi:hypothetical protein